MTDAKVIVVTGSSAGVGRAVAIRFAKAGYRIGLIARDEGALETVRAEIVALGSDAICAPADVADANAIFAAAEKIERAFGHIDIWVNNAMETVFSFFEDMSPDEFRRVTEVTYLGFVHGTMAALKSMRQRDRGTILQVGSALAYRGILLQAAYCGAKHAIRGFTASVRSELLHARSRVRITAVDLPAVNTPQFDWGRSHLPRLPRPMGRPVQPEVIANGVWRAAHGHSREYWIGGSTILTVIGNVVAPVVMDHFLAAKAVDGQMRPEAARSPRRDNLNAPVRELHRTRGSFSAGAANHAVMVPAPWMRAGIVAAGAATFFALGALAGRRGRTHPREHRPVLFRRHHPNHVLQMPGTYVREEHTHVR